MKKYILYTFYFVLHADVTTLFHGVVMLRMFCVAGSRGRFWNELTDSQYNQIFDIVKLFHKVNLEV